MPVTLVSGQSTLALGCIRVCVCLVSSCASYTGLWPVDFGSGVYTRVCVFSVLSASYTSLWPVDSGSGV